MPGIVSLSQLSFFKVTRYHYGDSYIHDFRQTPRPHYCMGLLLRGRAVFSSDGEKVEVGVGEIIFVPVGSCYISEWHGDPDVRYISLHFSFSGCGPFPREKKMKVQRLGLSLSEFADFERDFSAMHEKQNGSPDDQMAGLGLFFGVLGRLLTRIRFCGVRNLDRRIDKAIEYLDYNYDRAVTVGELAAIAGLSESYFYNRFRSETGMSPIEYKLRVAIDHAILLLIGDETLRVEEISDRLGFESSTYFRRVFRRFTGKSPMQYKRENVENP